MTPPGPGQVVTTLADQQQALLDAVFSRHQALPGGAASLLRAGAETGWSLTSFGGA